MSDDANRPRTRLELHEEIGRLKAEAQIVRDAVADVRTEARRHPSLLADTGLLYYIRLAAEKAGVTKDGKEMR